MNAASNVVVFFQGKAPARRPIGTVSQAGTGSELPTSKRPHRQRPVALHVPLSEVGELVTLALEAAHLTPAEAAAKMGISLTLFCRQLRNLDNQHVSMQRLYSLPNAFWLELWILIAKRRKLAHLQRRLVFDLAM